MCIEACRNRVEAGRKKRYGIGARCACRSAWECETGRRSGHQGRDEALHTRIARRARHAQEQGAAGSADPGLVDGCVWGG